MTRTTDKEPEPERRPLRVPWNAQEGDLLIDGIRTLYPGDEGYEDAYEMCRDNLRYGGKMPYADEPRRYDAGSHARD